MALSHWSLRKQMLLLGVMPALLMFFVLSSWFLYERFRDVESALEEKGAFLASQLAQTSEYPVISGNITALKDIVRPILKDPEVLYVSISDADAQVLLHQFGKAVSHANAETSSSDDRLFFSEVIKRQQLDVDTELDELDHILAANNDIAANNLGHVLVAMTTIEARNDQQKMLLVSAIPASISLIMAIGLALSLGGMTARPIIQLSQAARRIRDGDYSVRVEECNGGEIGSLESDINEMAAALRLSETRKDTLLQQMDAAREQAEGANKAKSDFLAMMSHELRTPMNGVLGMLQLLDSTSLNDNQKNYVQTGIESTNHLLSVINDILDFSRIENGFLETESVYIDLKKLVNNCAKSFEYAARDKGLEFNLEFAEELDAIEVKSDPTRLRQILVNLLGNAIKFTSSGYVRLVVTFEQRNEQQAKVKIEVEDSGMGIPDNVKDNIFMPFMQADSSLSRGFGGTGLGLSIAHKLTELLDGEMSVNSKEGSGSHFHCDFIMSFRNKTGSEVTVTEEPEKIPQGKSVYGSVLLVEDNEINMIVAQEMMRLLGVEPDLARNGKEALEMYTDKCYDYIFMDVQMPIMDGVEATVSIRQFEAENDMRPAHIIALTANAQQSEKERCLAKGMDDYLTKPFFKEEMLEKLERWS